jgi:hypothetical protein
MGCCFGKDKNKNTKTKETNMFVEEITLHRYCTFKNDEVF